MIASMREEIQGMKLSLGLGVSTDLHQVSIDLHLDSSQTDAESVQSYKRSAVQTSTRSVQTIDLHQVSTDCTRSIQTYNRSV